MTDLDARLVHEGKGREARPRYLANALNANRDGFLVAIDVRRTKRSGEREEALALADEHL